MTSHPALQSERAAFGHIASVARQIASRLTPLRPQPVTHAMEDVPTNLPNYVLPLPKPIVPTLLAAGLPRDAAELISQQYIAHALRLKQSNEQNAYSTLQTYFTADHHGDMQKEFSSICSIYRLRYERVLDGWVKASIREWKIFEQGQVLGRPPIASSLKALEEKKQNYNAMARLEVAFRANAYPSPAERMRLAQEMGMKPTQIHDWYQNRRNKFTKRGVQLRRSTTPPEVNARPTLSENIPIVLEPVRPSESTNRDPVDPFALKERPAYAFPASYDAGCELMSSSRPIQFLTPWLRRPSTVPVAVREVTSADIAAITKRLRKLSLEPSRHEAQTPERRRSGRDRVSSRGFRKRSVTLEHESPVPAPIQAAKFVVDSPSSSIASSPPSSDESLPSTLSDVIDTAPRTPSPPPAQTFPKHSQRPSSLRVASGSASPPAHKRSRPYPRPESEPSSTRRLAHVSRKASTESISSTCSTESSTSTYSSSSTCSSESDDSGPRTPSSVTTDLPAIAHYQEDPLFGELPAFEPDTATSLALDLKGQTIQVWSASIPPHTQDPEVDSSPIP